MDGRRGRGNVSEWIKAPEDLIGLRDERKERRLQVTRIEKG